MSDRAEFEQRFPVPLGVEWIDDRQGYRITSDGDYWFEIEGQAHFRGYLGQWVGWQAAREQESAPNLSGIAQKKLDQMGATVHGVLVKNEAGAWAAVSDAGRVMWLDGFEGEAACAQGGQAVAYAQQSVLDGLALHRANDYPAGGTVLATNAGGGRVPLYTNPSASVPDWKDLEALADEYVEGYEFRGDEGDYQPNERERFLIEDCVAGLMDEVSKRLKAATPQPADNWIKCSERAPTMKDADHYGQVIGWDRDNGESVIGPPCDFKFAPWLTHWMPTGLSENAPPEEGAE